MRALLLALAVVQALPLPRERLPVVRGTVVRVVDGDTLHVRVERLHDGKRRGRTVKVRLYGVDAPEREQPFGALSTRMLERLVLGREVEMAKVTRDDFGRTVALVRVDGRDVTSEMIRSGHGWAFRVYLGKLYGDRTYCALEYEARGARAGLWALEPRKRTAPWVYRHQGRGRHRIVAERSAEDCVRSFEGR